MAALPNPFEAPDFEIVDITHDEALRHDSEAWCGAIVHGRECRERVAACARSLTCGEGAWLCAFHAAEWRERIRNAR